MATILGPAGYVLATKVRIAATVRERMVGLIGGPRPASDEALVIPGAAQVHTVSLGFPIDVAFCGRDGVVLHVVREMKPARFSRWVRGVSYAIEMDAGALGRVDRGDVLEIKDL